MGGSILTECDVMFATEDNGRIEAAVPSGWRLNQLGCAGTIWMIVNPKEHKVYGTDVEKKVRGGKHESAIEEADRVIEQGLLGNDYIYFWRGEANRRLGNYEKALQDFDESIRQDGDGFEIHHCRGRSLFRLEEYAQAIHAFDKAAEFGKNFIPEDISLVEWFDADLDYLSQVVAENYFFRGASYFELGEYESAAVNFSFAIREAPIYPDCYWYRGESLEKLGLTEDAKYDMWVAGRLSSQGRQPLVY